MGEAKDRLVREFCRRVSPLTERLGFVLSPIHFYFPIPSVRELAMRRAWDHRTDLAGIDWNEAGQLAYLEYLAAYGHEARWPDDHRTVPAGQYAADAPTFGYTSAMLAWGAVRHFCPSRVIEVGCGWSSRVLLQALAHNAAGGGARARYLGIDPFPPADLTVDPASGRLLTQPVQSVPVTAFEELGPGDILFIDSSHVLNIGGDVAHLYMEVLPRLAPGVVVHVHDIQLPWEYPREYAEKQRWFWNEQYLLQAFLQFNGEWRILAAGHWLCRQHAGALRAAFPHYDPARHSPTGSFWMRRRDPRESRSY